MCACSHSIRVSISGQKREFPERLGIGQNIKVGISAASGFIHMKRYSYVTNFNASACMQGHGMTAANYQFILDISNLVVMTSSSESRMRGRALGRRGSYSQSQESSLSIKTIHNDSSEPYIL